MADTKNSADGQQKYLNDRPHTYDPLDLELVLETESDSEAGSKPFDLKDAGRQDDPRNTGLKYGNSNAWAPRIT